jgi:hypothetical protein
MARKNNGLFKYSKSFFQISAENQICLNTRGSVTVEHIHIVEEIGFVFKMEYTGFILDSDIYVMSIHDA